MDFYTVRARLVDGEPAGEKWRFRDRQQAAAKFAEVCGPLCSEAWLIHWVDDASVRGRKEVVLERHWTLRGGIHVEPTSLGRVQVLDDDESLHEVDDRRNGNNLDIGRELDRIFPTPDMPADAPSERSEESFPAVDADAVLRILVVDDDPVILEYLTALLCKWGHEALPKRVSSEEDAKNAIETVATANFDLLISHTVMPGMDGFRLVKSLAPVSPTTVFIISDCGLCTQLSQEFRNQGLWVEPLLRPFSHHDIQSVLKAVSLGHGRDFRRLLRGRVKVDAQPQLADGDLLARLLEPMVLKFVRGFNLSKIPLELWPRTIRTARRLVFWGLRTHCVLFASPYNYRRTDNSMDLDALYEDWLVKSLTASTYLRGYDTHSANFPSVVFDAVFDQEVEPIQKQLGLGWWRRLKNRAKFRNYSTPESFLP